MRPLHVAGSSRAHWGAVAHSAAAARRVAAAPAVADAARVVSAPQPARQARPGLPPVSAPPGPGRAQARRSGARRAFACARVGERAACAARQARVARDVRAARPRAA